MSCTTLYHFLEELESNVPYFPSVIDSWCVSHVCCMLRLCKFNNYSFLAKCGLKIPIKFSQNHFSAHLSLKTPEIWLFVLQPIRSPVCSLGHFTLIINHFYSLFHIAQEANYVLIIIISFVIIIILPKFVQFDFKCPCQFLFFLSWLVDIIGNVGCGFI